MNIFSFQVPTIFWWDNFDRSGKTSSGSGSLYTTPGITFQEEVDVFTMRGENISILKSNRRLIKLSDETNDAHATIHPKKYPPLFSGISIKKSTPDVDKICSQLLILWKSIRFPSFDDQTHPRYSGLIINRVQKADSKKISMTYLPPISSPITEYDAIIQMFKVSRELAKQLTCQHIL